MAAIPTALERHSEDGARVRLVETAAVRPLLPVILCGLGSELGLTAEALGLNQEDIAGAAGVKERATG